MKNEILSAVIVTNEHGAVATLRFSNPRKDRFISANNKDTLYTLVEDYVKKVTN